MRLEIAALVFATLVVAPACDKKDDAAPATATSAQPAAVSSGDGEHRKRDHEREGDGGRHDRGDDHPK
jgi:hypothetical protein